MDVTVYSYPSGDPVLIDKIVNEFLSQGKFDKLRKECMADADTKPAYQNLQLRVENIVSEFLKKQIWKPDLNKNQLRDSLRKHILESGFLDAGINRIVDQIVNPNVLATVFMPEVEEVVYSYLSIPRPGDKSQKQCDSATNNSNNIHTNKHWSEESKIPGSELDKDIKHKVENEEGQSNGLTEKIKEEDNFDKTCSKLSDAISSADQNVEIHGENTGKDSDEDIKREVEHMVIDEDSNLFVKEEFKPELIQEDANDKFIPEKMELPSDDSQESLSRMGVERLRISESDGVNAPDSDASIPLEINEKSMSESRDSDDSIMNKMSPISQGRLTPEDLSFVDEEKGEKNDERKEKNPLSFVGRIPKIKRDDSESSKSSKKDDSNRGYMKNVYSSDESDSSKHSCSKSDSDDKKSKEKKKSESSKTEEKYDKEKKYKEDEKRRKSDHHRSGDRKSHSKDGRNKDDKSRRDEKEKSHSRSRDEKRDRSRDKTSTGDKKNSSSSSSSHTRSKSSSHHKSVHKSGSHDKEHHRDDSKSRDKDKNRHDRKDKDKRDFDKRKKDEEKRKKSKSVDDHGKERNKRDDRRSTDRDSNERERDKTKESSSRIQSDGKKREKDGKVDDSRKEKNQGEESDRKEEETGVISHPVEFDNLEKDEAVEVEYINHEIVHTDMVIIETEESVIPMETTENMETEILNVKSLCSEGALTKVQFPKIIDDFYVKFNSTGFKYFEEWETTKMDCEDEFKEYIDEAEKDLSLLSDDGSDYESLKDHLESESLKSQIVSNSLRGLGNFEESLIFDPITYDFYKWTNKYHYRKYFGNYDEINSKSVFEPKNWSPGLTEDDEMHLSEKNKENHERDRKIRKSLKLLNRYNRKMGLKFKYGKEQHKFVRRRKKYENDSSKVKSIWNNWSEEQSRWRVLNASENVDSHDGGKELLTKSLEESTEETIEDEDELDEQEEMGVNEEDNSSDVLDSALVISKMDVESKMRFYQLQSIRGSNSEGNTQNTTILGRFSSGSREVDEDEEENVIKETGVTFQQYSPKKIKKRGIRIGLSRPKTDDLDRKTLDKKVNENYNLPLSPESDDSTFSSNGVIMPKKELSKNQRKRGVDIVSSPITTDLPTKKMKDHRRTVSQKYDSQDLYKPRPFSIGSKTRGRALRVEDDFTKIDSTEKKFNV